jgi:hypothetical protein
MPEPAQNGSRRHLLLTPPQMQLAFSKAADKITSWLSWSSRVQFGHALSRCRCPAGLHFPAGLLYLLLPLSCRSCTCSVCLQRKRLSWRTAEREALKRLLFAHGVGKWKEVGWIRHLSLACTSRGYSWSHWFMWGAEHRVRPAASAGTVLFSNMLATCTEVDIACT